MKIVLLLAVIVSSALVAFGQPARVEANDIKVLEGPRWTGSLSYLDYSSNKTTSIASDLIVERLPDNERGWKFDFKYPNEPRADSSSFVTIAPDGTSFNGQRVISRLRDANGLTIVTESEGTDNNKKAMFRFTYSLTGSTFSIKKEVKTEGSNEFFERNVYIWTR